MLDVDAQKIVLLTPPQLKDDGDLADNTCVDVSGFAHARFLITTGTIDAALGSTTEATAVKVEECDTPEGTYTDVDDAELADAIAATEDDSMFCIDVDLRKSHKRYMRVNAPHAGDGTNGVNACIHCILSNPIGHAPGNATERGFAEQIKA